MMMYHYTKFTENRAVRKISSGQTRLIEIVKVPCDHDLVYSKKSNIFTGHFGL